MVGEDILDVDHPDDRIEILLIDRHPAVPGLGKGVDQGRDGDVGGHGEDVAARHGEVAHRLLAEMQDVEQHLPLDLGEIAAAQMLAFTALDRFLDLIAQRRLAAAAEDEALQASPETAPFLALARTVVFHWVRILPL